MWPLEEYHFDASVLDTLRSHGFECAERAGRRVEARRKNVAAAFVRDEAGKLRLAGPPGYLIRGQFARLWDAGNQKLWLVGDPTPEPDPSRAVAVRAVELEELHKVSEELRTLLGIPSFYNESLGTTCHVTAYDRLGGRGSTTARKPGERHG